MATYAKMDKGFPGFATGYNYFFKYVVLLANNLTAAGIIIQYWRPELNVGIWITVFAIPVLSINFFHVRVFGESQYIAGVVKLLVMTMLIISCLVASLKPVEGRGVVGFRYWKDSGAFGEYIKHGGPGRFLGFWAAFVQAGFAYIGTEVVGAAFGETPNIKKEVPRAIFWTFWRIVFFYIGGVVVLGMSCPYRNEMLVGATHSKASADIYVASRTLYALSKDHQAPQIFKRTVKQRIPTLRTPLTLRDRLSNLCVGVPLASVLSCSAFFLLGYLNISKSSSTVFGYFVSLVTVFGALNWVSILISYICFSRGLRAQVITVLLILFNGFDAFIYQFDASRFVTSYIGVLIFAANYYGWKLFAKTKWVEPKEMDLVNNCNIEPATETLLLGQTAGLKD
ncbi:hypothetical protein SLS58_008804 [Diplodia intermedia]|uniref:Amino acid permease/ SLC12A domain-containing protein n=1 Tax=Diplodia intermedia TaxID=856260 RepID=A0ABR3TGN2_9PEZI